MVSLDGATPPEANVLDAMVAALHHRGPDSAGTVYRGPAALGARRLAIIDLPAGDQPIPNETGTVHVVQNGEIYNHAKLADDLRRRGHRIATGCDTEVIAHLYEEHGLEFVHHLRGMFAIAIWDAGDGRLVLARDRFGIKPLHYAVVAGRLSFASELRSLVRQPGFPTELSLDALEAYLTFNWIPGELSVYEHVRRLPAGHLLVAERGKVRLERFARPKPPAASDVHRVGFDEAAVQVRDVLRDSVAAHLVSDVPVGVLLSGGVDSSLLTALAAEQSGERLRTFSIGFDDREYDEVAKARQVAERYGTDHHELIVTPDAVALLPTIAETFDEPFGDSSALPTYIVSQLAASHVKVVLAGEGGDELFGGYNTYAADAVAARLGWVGARLHPLVERLDNLPLSVRSEDRLRRFLAHAAQPPLERHCAFSEVLSAEARAELISANGPRADPLATHRTRWEETVGAQAIARFQDLDLGTYLVDDPLLKTDRASMANSLETRVPFLDSAVADLALGLPDSFRVRGLAKKRVLRAAAAPLLPKGLLDAPKQGFSIPAARWLREDLREFTTDALSPVTVGAQGYLNPAAVQALLSDHLSGRRDRSRQLWGILMFTRWLDTHLRSRHE